MASIPPSAPPTNADAETDNFGPVTKLAQLAAAQAEEDRIQQRRLDHAAQKAALKAQAALVGQTATVLAAAAASGSSILRLSPRQTQNILHPTFEPKKKMSVAARSRAMADMPTRPTMAVRQTGSPMQSMNPTRPSVGVQQTSGNAGVTKGRFTKAQVNRISDGWGKGSDTDDDDYYYDGTSDSSGGHGGGNHEQFKHTLERAHHQLQYTMSQSPGAKSQESTAAGTEFHYQHHRVSAYNTNKRSNAVEIPTNYGDGTNSSYDEEYEEGGLFASAKNWLQSQRERLHHMELQRQVEDQRRKLVEEARRQRSLEADRHWKNGGAHNNKVSPNTNDGNSNHKVASNTTAVVNVCQPREIAASSSFGCIDGDYTEGGEDEEELCPEQGVIVTGIMPDLCGFGGAYANQMDDATDYSGVARVDSAGNILEMVPSGSFDDDDGIGEHMKVGMKVSSPKCTLSGNGMSVNVDIPDDNNYNLSEEVEYNDGVNNAINRYNIEEEEKRIIPTEEEEDDPYFVESVKIVPEPPQDDVSSSPCVLQPSQMKALIASGGLPPSLNFCKWKRLYCVSRDGDSFEQFLRLVQGHNRTILVVRTTRGGLFGGFADTRWEAKHNRRYANEFYGSAQAFLFRFPNYGQGRREDKIVIYKWSGANRYIQLCDAARRTVAFGGGGDEGDFGLCIEEDFRRGTTGHCSTFENEALCDEGYFDVQDLEVWGFDLGF